jgi:hypothetical protein
VTSTPRALLQDIFVRTLAQALCIIGIFTKYVDQDVDKKSSFRVSIGRLGQRSSEGILLYRIAIVIAHS